MEKMCYCIIRAAQQYSDTDEHHQGGMDMAWQFRNDIPIYTQLIAQIQQRIVSGALLPGERLPSVRDLAAEAGVNPNTMQRAMMEMEREELVYSQRTAGRVCHRGRGADSAPAGVPGPEPGEGLFRGNVPAGVPAGRDRHICTDGRREGTP